MLACTQPFSFLHIRLLLLGFLVVDGWLVFGGRVSCHFGWPHSYYVPKDSLEYLIFLPLPPKSSDIDVCHHTWLMWCWELKSGCLAL